MNYFLSILVANPSRMKGKEAAAAPAKTVLKSRSGFQGRVPVPPIIARVSIAAAGATRVKIEF